MQVCSSQCENNRMDDMGVHPIFFRPGALYTDLQQDNIKIQTSRSKPKFIFLLRFFVLTLFLVLSKFCSQELASFKCFYQIKTNIPRRYFKPINLFQLFHPENWYLFGENWLLFITLPASEFSAARETFLLWTNEARQFFTPTVLGHL